MGSGSWYFQYVRKLVHDQMPPEMISSKRLETRINEFNLIQKIKMFLKSPQSRIKFPFLGSILFFEETLKNKITYFHRLP